MIHTNFTLAFNILEKLALKEIASAVRAHHGEYVFTPNSSIIVVGRFLHAENTEDIILTRITLDASLNFYGSPAHYLAKEQLIKEIEPSSYGYVLDGIQPTPQIKGVRNIEDVFNTVDSLRNTLLTTN